MAIRQSPAAVDASTPVFASGIVWEATPVEARFDFSMTAATDAACATGMACDGLNFAYALDLDGSLLGAPNATATGNNPLAVVGARFSGQPGFILLADHAELSQGGHAEDLQDHDCALAGPR